MMKVYVLTSFYYDEGNIGVFSSREKAEAVMRDSDRVDQKDVQEFEVDELVGHVVMPTYIASIEKGSGVVRESMDRERRHPSALVIDGFSDSFRISSPISAEHARSEAVRVRQEWLRTKELKETPT
jgi:hypothetical protein